ncbi:MAG: phosphotransferase family protein [Pseudonocardiaceae bacterium]
MIAAASSDLWQTATAITLGVGQAELDLDRLDRLIPCLDADEPPRQVGGPDGRWLLIDWDRASHGPRELDLAFAVLDHFHDPDTERADFSVAYGYDITSWTGWTLIRDLSELHSLASYIRRAATNPAAHDELHRRVDSLLTDDRSVVWRSVSA